MTTAPGFPFNRVIVDHMFHGTTRVWWWLSEQAPPPPHLFRLQASYAGNSTSLDWVDVAQDTHGTMLVFDSSRELRGKNLLTHFRILLSCASGTFYSNPEPAAGLLSRENWVLTRELARKQKIQQAKTGVFGYLLRRMRYGETDGVVIDKLTGAQGVSFSRTSWGTPFKVGYHPPVPFYVEPEPGKRVEFKGGASIDKYNRTDDAMLVKALASPAVMTEDVWVDAATDERWRVGQEVATLTAFQGVPVLISFQLSKIPHNDIVYHIPVDEWSTSPLTTEDNSLSRIGTGCIAVDHDYPQDEAMTYVADCCDVVGASVKVFRKSDWLADRKSSEFLVAETVTTTGGRWASALLLDPGEYVVEFALDGLYGPDSVDLLVAEGGSSSGVIDLPGDTEFTTRFG